MTTTTTTNMTTNTMTTNTNMTATTITNSFTGYSAKILTDGLPAVATILRHLRKSKARDCRSITLIEIDGIRHDLRDLGYGLALIQL